MLLIITKHKFITKISILIIKKSQIDNFIYAYQSITTKTILTTIAQFVPTKKLKNHQANYIFFPIRWIS